MNNAIMYHNQADVDAYAKIPDDLEPAIIQTTLKLIKEAYKEFLDDLLIESMEAY